MLCHILLEVSYLFPVNVTCGYSVVYPGKCGFLDHWQLFSHDMALTKQIIVPERNMKFPIPKPNNIIEIGVVIFLYFLMSAVNLPQNSDKYSPM